MFNKITKKVVQKNITKYAYYIANHWLGRKPKMSKQAKTFTPEDLRRVLDHVATRKHAARNRAMVLFSHLAGVRISELVAIRYNDVVDEQGRMREEFRLRAEETKGKHARTVFLNQKLRKELAAYIKVASFSSADSKLFRSQKGDFSANTGAQFFHYLYAAAGILGASSHSGRRSCLTSLSSKGVSIRVLMKIAGHRSPQSTIRYLDASDDMLRKAMELV